MTIYGYKKEVNISGDIKPKNTHLDFDLASGNKIELRGFDKEDVFYNFSIGDYIYIYKSGRITKMEEKE